MSVGPQVGIGGCSSLVEDDLVLRACDWLLMTYGINLVIFVFKQTSQKRCASCCFDCVERYWRLNTEVQRKR